VLRKMFRPKGEAVIGDYWKYHSQELHDLYFSSYTRVISSRRMRWAGHREEKSGDSRESDTLKTWT